MRRVVVAFFTLLSVLPLTGCDPMVLQAVAEGLEQTNAELAAMNQSQCAAMGKYYDPATGICHYNLPNTTAVYVDDEDWRHQQLHQCLDDCHYRFGADGEEFDSERLRACRTQCSDQFER